MATAPIQEADRRRSPNFPFVSLEEAVGFIRRIYTKDRTATTTRDVAVKHIGYSSMNGSAKRALSSLLQYGLLEEVGQGRVRVSMAAEGILVPKSNDEQAQLANDALHRPPVFNKLLDQFGNDLPSDDTLRAQLIRDHRFLERAARECIKSLRAGVEYVANLGFSPDGLASSEKPATVEDPVNAKGAARIHEQPSGSVAHIDCARIDVPLSKRARAELVITGQFGNEELSRFEDWLKQVVGPWAQFQISEDDLSDQEDQ